MLSERSQSQKITYNMIPFIGQSLRHKSIDSDTELISVQGIGWGRARPQRGSMREFSRVKLFCILIVVVVT